MYHNAVKIGHGAEAQLFPIVTRKLNRRISRISAGGEVHGLPGHAGNDQRCVPMPYNSPEIQLSNSHTGSPVLFVGAGYAFGFGPLSK